MAETIARLIPSVEVVRMVNSGTEATMSAIRLARGYTGARASPNSKAAITATVTRSWSRPAPVH